MTPLPPWFVFVLFSMWGIGLLCSSVARALRYYKYQRDAWLLASAAERCLMAIALMLGSLTVAPHPMYDFKWLILYARYAWLFAFVPFGIGVFLEWHSMARIKQARESHDNREEKWQPQP